MMTNRDVFRYIETYFEDINTEKDSDELREAILHCVNYASFYLDIPRGMAINYVKNIIRYYGNTKISV